MESNKLLSMLGLSKKAGAVLMGFEAVVDAMSQKKVHLLLVTQDLSSNTLKKVKQAAELSSTHYAVLPMTMDELEKQLRKRVGIIGVTDENFAGAIGKLLPTDEGGLSIDD